MGFIKKLLGLEKKYVCDECGKSFTSRRAYMLHKGNHKTRSVNIGDETPKNDSSE
ncbi:MAG: hypothetical protein KAJ20_02855 [Candidatus Aenigmarchaeota archaeon]|nr:hypothetical protein [Candidatus Aenigmarchaeota archaeon]NOQ37999.1 hypothetical protein [archaeon]